MLLTCKYCGGELEITANETVTTCKYCRTAQTLPKTSDEGAHNLFNRANNLRRRCEFDKAEALYEKIIESNETEAEAYWCLILCKYGIEYVEDPKSKKMLPTCHRASYSSVIADEDYKSALEYADAESRALYEQQAKEIDRIQKNILALSENEESYDIFICYKETDDNGKRTRDSVTASEIYYELTDAGYKVFYAAITLEGKLGSEYEPIIFAALNSAKVMLAVGSKPEYFNSVWVKNEWSRFLKIIKNDRKRLLIPCYRDMDAYDLPEEFAHLQAQDMSKIGFVSDIIRGIKKVIKSEEPEKTAVRETIVKETVINNLPSGDSPGAANVDALLKRVFIFLEDGDFKSANEYCEKVLDIDPENALAYLGKLMAEQKVKNRDSLKKCKKSFAGSGNYQRAVRYADSELKAELTDCVKHIVYTEGAEAMKSAKNETDFKEAEKIFRSVSDYKDADALALKCAEKAAESKKIAEMAKSAAEAKQRKEEEEKRREERRLLEEKIRLAKKKRNRRIAVALVAILLIGAAVVSNLYVIPAVKTNNFISEYGQAVYDKYGFVAKGEYITFGSYEQDADQSNGKEAIEWLVLDVKDGRALLISRYALDWKQFHPGDYGTWSGSAIRHWLNTEFRIAAFTEEELSAVPEVTNVNKNEDDTVDRVFLLSTTERDTYLKSKSKRKCEHTPYAVSKGAYVYKHNLGGKNNCIWWLRTSNEDVAVCVDIKGEGYTSEKSAYFAVRPAIWIDLKA